MGIRTLRVNSTQPVQLAYRKQSCNPMMPKMDIYYACQDYICAWK